MPHRRLPLHARRVWFASAGNHRAPNPKDGRLHKNRRQLRARVVFGRAVVDWSGIALPRVGPTVKKQRPQPKYHQNHTAVHRLQSQLNCDKSLPSLPGSASAEKGTDMSLDSLRDRSHEDRHAAYLLRKQEHQAQQRIRRNRKNSIKHMKGHCSNVGRLGRGKLGGDLLREIQFTSCMDVVNRDSDHFVEAFTPNSLLAAENADWQMKAPLRPWRRRCQRWHCWWWESFKLIVGAHVKLTHCSLVDPQCPKAVPRLPHHSRSNAVVAKGTLGTIVGTIPNGGALITFEHQKHKMWQIPPDHFCAFKSMKLLEPGRCCQHASGERGVIVSHVGDCIVFRGVGKVLAHTCRVSDILPLKGMAETFQIGECVETSERKMLQIFTGCIRLSEETIVVEVCDVPEPGIVRVKTHDGRAFAHGARTSSTWLYDVPVSVLQRLQWSVLTPHFSCRQEDEVSISFTNLGGVEVASGFVVRADDSLPVDFWKCVSEQANIPEVQLALVLLDGRVFKGNVIQRITHVQDMLPSASLM